MRRLVLTLSALATLATALVLSAVVALACVEWEDPPPVSTQGAAHMSSTASTIITSGQVVTGANSNAFPASGHDFVTKNGPVSGTNPGNK